MAKKQDAEEEISDNDDQEERKNNEDVNNYNWDGREIPDNFPSAAPKRLQDGEIGLTFGAFVSDMASETAQELLRNSKHP